MPLSSTYNKTIGVIHTAILAILLCTTSATMATAQTQIYPTEGGNVVKLNAFITTKHTCISGVCALRLQNDTIRGIVINEFGISALSFQYKIGEKRAKILDGVHPVRRPIVRRIIGRDLALCMQGLAQGDTICVNTKQNIRYEFSPLPKAETSHATAQ